MRPAALTAMKQNCLVSLIAIMALLPLFAAGAGAEYNVSTGFDYSTGKYGDTASTDILYLPLIGACEGDTWAVKLTIPYIRLKGPGNVTPDLGPIGQGSGTTKIETQSGLGDIVASGGFDFYQNRRTGLIIGAAAKIKFGTASQTKGLGTGKNDYYLQLDSAQPFGNFTPFASLGYRIVGNPTGYDLHNVFYGSFGSTYRLSPRDSVGASWDLREKINDLSSAASELTAFYTHKIDAAWRVQAYAMTGFTDASPDFGLGSIVGYRF
jgi:hypothetical protein